MAQNIPAYRKLGIQGYSMPSMSFSNLKEQANMFHELNDKIGAVVSYANEQISAEQKLAGQEYAVGNPITIDQYYDANPTEIAKQIEAKGGNDRTVRGQAVKATLIELLSTDVIIEANSHIGKIYDDAVTNNITIEELENKLNGAIDGYYKSIVSISPEAGIKIKAQLGIKANTYHRNYANKLLDKALVAKQAKLLSNGYAEMEDIPEIIRAGALNVELNDGTTATVNIDTQLNRLKFAITETMIANQFSESQIKSFESAWDTAVIEGKRNFLEDIQRDLYPDEKGMDFLYLVQEEFLGIDDLEDGPAKNKLLQAQGIFNSLEDKETIYTNIMNQINANQTRVGILAGQIAKAEKTFLNKKTNEFNVAMVNGDLTKAREVVEFLATNPVYATEVGTLLEILQKSDAIGFNTPNLEDKVRTQILTSSVNVYDIYQLIENNDDNVFGSGTLKLETINTLIKEAKSANTGNIITAMTIVKATIKNMPEDPDDRDSWNTEEKIAMQLYERIIQSLVMEQTKYEDLLLEEGEADNPFNPKEFVLNMIKEEKKILKETGITETISSITNEFKNNIGDEELTLDVGGTQIKLVPITKDITPKQIDQWIDVLEYDLSTTKDKNRILITEDNGYKKWNTVKYRIEFMIENLKTLKAQLAEVS